MVKKVIDIIPPQSQESEDSEGQPILDQDQPSIAPYIETPAKPKITFVASAENLAPKNKRSWKFGGATGFLIKLALILAVFFGILFAIDARYQRAIVTINPQTQSVKASGQISVDTKLSAVDMVKQSIPGVAVTIDKDFSGDFKATGKASTQAKAKGSVKITNNFATAQRLIAGTRLQAPTDKFQPALTKDQSPWFRTVSDVTVQPKASVTVNVVADGPGVQYNIAPSAFSIPGLVGTPQYTYITVQSSDKFTGGTDTAVAQVTQDDLDKAKNSLASIIQDQMKNELQQKITAAQFLIPDTIVVTLGDIMPNVVAGTASETFTDKVKVHATAVVANKSDLDIFGKNLILNNIPAGSVYNEGSMKVSESYVKIDSIGGQVILSLNAEATDYPKLDARKFQEALAGKSAGEAKALLFNDPGVKAVEIKLTPFWRTNLPNDTERINIQSVLN